MWILIVLVMGGVNGAWAVDVRHIEFRDEAACRRAESALDRTPGLSVSCFPTRLKVDKPPPGLPR